MTSPVILGRVPGVVRTVAILRALSDAGVPLGLGVLATRVSAPKSSVMSLCRDLVAERMLSRGEDGRYWIGPRWVEYAAAQRRLMPQVRQIGFSIRRMSNPFHAAQAAAARRLAHDLRAEIVVLDADLDANAQSAHIEHFVDRGVDLILVEPVSSSAATAAVARAAEDSIPVVAIGAHLVGAAITVASDDVQAGQLAAQFAARLLGGQGAITVFAGPLLSAISDRLRGFIEVAGANPDLVVTVDDGVYSDGTDARAKLSERVLASSADLFFATNDQLALRVSEVLLSAGRGTPIIGVDGSGAAIEQIRGTGPIIATVAQSPMEIVERAVEVGVALRQGTRFAVGTVLLPTALITGANLRGIPEW